MNLDNLSLFLIKKFRLNFYSMKNSSKILRSINKKFLIYQGISRQNRKKIDIKNKKALVLQFAGLGDAALLAPFIRGLKNIGIKPELAVPGSYAQFWEYFFPDDKIIPVDISIGFNGFLNDLAEAKLSGEYEAVFGCSLTPLCAYLAGFPYSSKKVGMLVNGRKYKGARIAYNNFYDAEKNEHVQNRYQSLFSKVYPEIKPKKFFDSNNNSENYIAVHPGAKWKPRRWLQEYFLKLFEKIEDKPVKVLFGGSMDEELYNYFNHNNLPSNTELVKTESLTEFIDNIAYCSLFLGNDSGPAHIANLMNKKTVVLWGPGNYERVRPLGDNVDIIIKEIDCRPCKQYVHLEHCERGDNICLKSISPEEVYEAIAKKG